MLTVKLNRKFNLERLLLLKGGDLNILFSCNESGTVDGTNTGFEVSTAVTTKIDAFWDVTQCGSCKNRRFGGTYV
jgi:hypothetical protein